MRALLTTFVLAFATASMFRCAGSTTEMSAVERSGAGMADMIMTLDNLGWARVVVLNRRASYI
jgi:hypothetical protein